jgi:hypothetical protein
MSRYEAGRTRLRPGWQEGCRRRPCRLPEANVSKLWLTERIMIQSRIIPDRGAADAMRRRPVHAAESSEPGSTAALTLTRSEGRKYRRLKIVGHHHGFLRAMRYAPRSTRSTRWRRTISGFLSACPMSTPLSRRYQRSLLTRLGPTRKRRMGFQFPRFVLQRLDVDFAEFDHARTVLKRERTRGMF